jgi:hypothetical protein
MGAHAAGLRVGGSLFWKRVENLCTIPLHSFASPSPQTLVLERLSLQLLVAHPVTDRQAPNLLPTRSSAVAAPI